MHSLLAPLLLATCININGVVTATTPPITTNIYEIKEEIAPITNAMLENYKYRQRIKLVATAYTSDPKENGSSHGITASGKRLSRGMVATPRNIPFGTKIYVPDLYKTYVAEDRGHPNHIKWLDEYTMRIDIFINSKAQAIKFGKRSLEGYIYKEMK